MWTAIKLFFNGNIARIAQILAIAVLVGVTVAAIYHAGKKSERVAELEREVKAGKKANAVKNNNSALSDTDVDRRLRERWSR